MKDVELVAIEDIQDYPDVVKTDNATETDHSARSQLALIQLQERGHKVTVRKEWFTGPHGSYGPILYGYYRHNDRIIRECLGPVAD